MVRVKAGKPLLGGHRKSSFPIRRNKKTINPGPNGRITRDRPSIRSSSERKIHKTLIKDKITKIPNGRHTTMIVIIIILRPKEWWLQFLLGH
jgi:hypothetical protein